MQKITTEAGLVFGPFAAVQAVPDGYFCDGLLMPSTVLGASTVSAWDGPIPETVPVVQVPQSVTRFQARAALAVAGLFDAVDAIMQSPETPLITRLEWLDKQSFRRDSPTVAWAGERLGLTSDQLDALFVAASEIQI